MNINDIINQTLTDLTNNDYSNFDDCLTLISQAIQSANKESEELTTIDQILSYTPENNVLQLRLYRGLLLIIRNAAPNLNTIYFPKVITSFTKFQKLDENEWVDKSIQVYWEILANFKRNEYIEEINELFNKTKISPTPVVHFLFRQFYSEESDTTNENLLKLLKIRDNHVLNTIFNLYTKIGDDHDSKMLIHLIYDIITHESFKKWIDLQEDQIKWLELTSVILETNDDWDNFQLIGLLAWVVPIFLDHADKVNVETINDENLEKYILNSLHILAETAKFKAAIQFFDHEQLLKPLISLLKITHENVERVTMKSKVEELIPYSSAKSYIIISLSYMTYQSTKNQNLIRELGGLALILSNCQIDENNPFIKEQAILCVKYLLENNSQNQQFVAELEAKKTVDDSILQDVGYKVDIVDGKVELKKK
ncbi:uncharacterized protein KGF55_002003 [Candida pseudojiufengensis]|uniref:uncharacterized protein n=1 Tax=Candida pseudojiufengensis TaxID=497109 RepID=UPI002225A08F|nr:uncharacterized protein KGF55_002003 [Candida pseudojiufengensis]KAI5964061.1 hypothetical protein KGF55_002003 [Candida pseudojiufengensis]